MHQLQISRGISDWTDQSLPWQARVPPTVEPQLMSSRADNMVDLHPVQKEITPPPLPNRKEARDASGKNDKGTLH